MEDGMYQQPKMEDYPPKLEDYPPKMEEYPPKIEGHFLEPNPDEQYPQGSMPENYSLPKVEETGFEPQQIPDQMIPRPGPQPNRPPTKFISVTSEALTEEQRAMYESVLSTWKPIMFPKRTKRYICQKCNKEFKNYQNLYLHTTRVHSSEESAVICDICDKTFKNKHYLTVLK